MVRAPGFRTACRRWKGSPEERSSQRKNCFNIECLPARIHRGDRAQENSRGLRTAIFEHRVGDGKGVSDAVRAAAGEELTCRDPGELALDGGKARELPPGLDADHVQTRFVRFEHGVDLAELQAPPDGRELTAVALNAHRCTSGSPLEHLRLLEPQV